MISFFQDDGGAWGVGRKGMEGIVMEGLMDTVKTTAL